MEGSEQPILPEPVIEAEPLAADGKPIGKRIHNGGRRERCGRKMAPFDGMKALPVAVQAVLQGKSVRASLQSEAKLNSRQAENLSVAIGQDIDDWRRQFGADLRTAAQEMLSQLRESIAQGKVPPQSQAFTLSVLADKAQALEGRQEVRSATVNVQVNNYGQAQSKEDLIAQLKGVKPA